MDATSDRGAHPSSTIFARYASVADLNRMHDVEKGAWGNGAASKEELHRRLTTHGFSNIVVTDTVGVIHAFTTTMRINVAAFSGAPVTWKRFCLSDPSPGGDILYGLNLSLARTRGAFYAGRVAMEATLGSVVDQGCHGLFAGGRLPGYHRWAACLSPQVYAGLAKNGRDYCYVSYSNKVLVFTSRAVLEEFDQRHSNAPSFVAEDCVARRILRNARFVDPQVHFYRQCRCSGEPIRILGVIPEYFEDPDSLNNGLLYCWCNGFKTSFSRLAASIAQSVQPVCISPDVRGMPSGC